MFRFNDKYSLLYLVKKLFYKLKNINMEEVNYKWVIGQGWVVESENEQLKLMVEETLKEVDRTINFQEYLENINMKDNELEEMYDLYCKSFLNQDIIEQYSFDTEPMTKVMFVEKIKNLDWFKNEWIEKLKNSKQ